MDGSPSPGDHHGGTALGAPEGLLEILHAIQQSLPHIRAEQWQIAEDGPSRRKDRLDWLQKDIGSREFLRANRLDEALLQMQTAQGALHLGVWVLGFPTCKNTADTISAVKKAGRLNFKLKALTVFRARAWGSAVVFAVSETPLHPDVGVLFEKMDVVLGNRAACL
jgi:hypothetical protein